VGVFPAASVRSCETSERDQLLPLLRVEFDILCLSISLATACKRPESEGRLRNLIRCPPSLGGYYSRPGASDAGPFYLVVIRAPLPIGFRPVNRQIWRIKIFEYAATSTR
jgi:hypothetical protein